MAQETNIRPIELNNDTTKIIMDLGDSLQKNRLQKAQLAADKQKLMYEAQKDYQNKMFQTTSEIPAMVKGIDEKFQADAMAQLVKVSSENMGKIDPITMKQKMNEAVTYYTGLGNKSKAIASQVENYTKALPAGDQSNFATNRLIEDVNKMALYKEVDGKLILKKPEEINENEDYVAKVLNGPDGWKYWNGAAGMETLQKVIKDGEKVTEKAKVTDQKGLVRTLEGTTVKYNPLFQRQNPTTGKVELKTDETGNLDEGTYQQIITDPKVNASFSRMAKTFVDNYNSIKPEDRAAFLKQSGMDVSDVTSGTTLPASIDEKSPLYAATFDTLKRAFATDFVARNIGKSEEETQSKTIIQNNVSGGNQFPIRDYFGKVEDLVDSRQKGRYAAVSDLPSNLIELVVNAANSTGGVKKRGKVTPYTYGDIVIGRNNAGDIAVFKSKDGSQIATLDPETFNADANQYLSNKAAKAGQGAGRVR